MPIALDYAGMTHSWVAGFFVISLNPCILADQHNFRT